MSGGLAAAPWPSLHATLCAASFGLFEWIFHYIGWVAFALPQILLCGPPPTSVASHAAVARSTHRRTPPIQHAPPPRPSCAYQRATPALPVGSKMLPKDQASGGRSKIEEHQIPAAGSLLIAVHLHFCLQRRNFPFHICASILHMN